MRLTAKSLVVALGLAVMAIAPHAGLAGTTGQIVLSGVVHASVNTRAITPTATANGTAIAIGCNAAIPLHVSLEHHGIENASAAPAGAAGDPGRLIVSWRSTAPRDYVCEAGGQELVIPMPPAAPGESVTTRISIN